MESIQPVLHLQTGNLREIHEVSRQHRGVVFQRDAGDAQVHCEDLELEISQAIKDVGGVVRPAKDRSVGKLFQASLKLRVGINKAVLESVLNRMEPAFAALLGGDDCKGDQVRINIHALDHSGRRQTASFNLGEVIGVKNHHEPAQDPPATDARHLFNIF